MGSNLGRMLAITLPLAGIGIAAPFLAPALLGPAAATAGTAGAVGGTAGATGGLAAGATPAVAAAAPSAIGAAPAAAPAAVGSTGAATAGSTAGGITPAMAAQGVQAGTSLTSGLLNQALNQPQMPTMPTIRAPVQSSAPMFSTNDIPSPVTGGLTSSVPGPGPMAANTGMGGFGMAPDFGSQIAQNLFSDQNPFAQYAMAA